MTQPITGAFGSQSVSPACPGHCFPGKASPYRLKRCPAPETKVAGGGQVVKVEGRFLYHQSSLGTRVGPQGRKRETLMEDTSPTTLGSHSSSQGWSHPGSERMEKGAWLAGLAFAETLTDNGFRREERAWES